MQFNKIVNIFFQIKKPQALYYGSELKSFIEIINSECTILSPYCLVTVNLLTNPESPNKAHFRPTVTEESEKSTMFIYL